jgi:hypothetical protein
MTPELLIPALPLFRELPRFATDSRIVAPLEQAPFHMTVDVALAAPHPLTMNLIPVSPLLHGQVAADGCPVLRHAQGRAEQLLRRRHARKARQAWT